MAGRSAPRARDTLIALRELIQGAIDDIDLYERPNERPGSRCAQLMIARLLTYPPAMVLQRPSGFIEPCLPSKAVRPPSGPLWVHEIKHDGYRLMVRRDGLRVRCFTRNGHDWADRFPAIVEAAARLEAHSFLIDGEVVITSDDGMSDFRALRSKRRGPEAVLYAFDLLQHDGANLRDLPLIERKQRLARLLGRAKRQAICFNEHLTGDGPTIFKHVCRMGLEGLFRSGSTHRIAAGRQRYGSNRRTRLARRCAGSARRSCASLAPGHHSQMENRTLTIKATLRISVAIPATSMLKTRRGSNAMRHRWRQ